MMPKKCLFAAAAAAVLFGFAFIACDTGGPSPGPDPAPSPAPGPGPGPGPDQPGPGTDPVTNVLIIQEVSRGAVDVVGIAGFVSGETQIEAGTSVTITVTPDQPTELDPAILVSSAIAVTGAASNTAAGILFANEAQTFTLVMPAAANTPVTVAVTFEDLVEVAVKRLTVELPAKVAGDTILAGKIEARLLTGLGKLDFSGAGDLAAAIDLAFNDPRTFDPGNDDEAFFVALRGIGAIMWHGVGLDYNVWLFHLADREISPGLPFTFDDMMQAGVLAMAADVAGSDVLTNEDHPVNMAWAAYADDQNDTTEAAFVEALASFFASFSEDFLDGAFEQIAKEIRGII